MDKRAEGLKAMQEAVSQKISGGQMSKDQVHAMFAHLVEAYGLESAGALHDRLAEEMTDLIPEVFEKGAENTKTVVYLTAPELALLTSLLTSALLKAKLERE